MPPDWIHPYWAHLTTTLRGHWLPGDARGFRSRDHRIHSTGDYLEPPPAEEHEGLRRWAAARTDRAAPLTPSEREMAASAFVEAFRRRGVRVLSVACAPTHAHALVEVIDQDGIWLLGRAKQLASARLPGRDGRTWGRGGGVGRIRSMEHLRSTVLYIRDHRSEGASVLENRPLMDRMRVGGGWSTRPNTEEIRLFVEDSSEAASGTHLPSPPLFREST